MGSAFSGVLGRELKAELKLSGRGLVVAELDFGTCALHMA